IQSRWNACHNWRMGWRRAHSPDSVRSCPHTSARLYPPHAQLYGARRVLTRYAMPEPIVTEELPMPFPDGHALLIGVGAYAHLPHGHEPTTMHDRVSHLAPQRTSGMRFLSADMVLECSAAEDESHVTCPRSLLARDPAAALDFRQ